MHELDLQGLRFASEFKKAVWAMKRGKTPASAAVPLQEGMQSASAYEGMRSAPAQQDMNAQTLLEIRDELRKLNAQVAGGGYSTMSSNR